MVRHDCVYAGHPSWSCSHRVELGHLWNSQWHVGCAHENRWLQGIEPPSCAMPRYCKQLGCEHGLHWSLHVHAHHYQRKQPVYGECESTDEENCVCFLAKCEQNWFWTADHDIDDSSNTQITIFSGRGLYVESTAGTFWLYVYHLPGISLFGLIH